MSVKTNNQQEEKDVDFVCHGCIRDQFLANEVKKQGLSRQCSYCDESREAISLGSLAVRIHEVLQQHYQLTPSEPSEGIDYVRWREGLWHRAGYPVVDLIGDVAGLTLEIAKEVVNVLRDCHDDPCAIRDGETAFYEEDAYYDELAPNDVGFQEEWDAFSREIRSHARFFSPVAEDSLRTIFGDLNKLKPVGDLPLIREIVPGGNEPFIWRARKAESINELKTMLEDPVQELGPPPPRLAKGGRMNAEGIPVFYGALEQETCVAEVRAPVGSHVVVAGFEALRPLRLLDLDSLKKVYVDGSLFDPHYTDRSGRACFLGKLVDEISRPVMPRDEAFEYVTTQAVAEYLANKVELGIVVEPDGTTRARLDGIIFSSSQTGNAGSNVVLFNHACAVEPTGLPEGTIVAANVDPYAESTGEREADDYIDNSIGVLESVPRESVPPSSTPMGEKSLADPFRTAPAAGFSENNDRDEESDAPNEDAVLRLDVDSILVCYIRGVRYDHERREVRRHRVTEGDKEWPFAGLDITPPKIVV